MTMNNDNNALQYENPLLKVLAINTTLYSKAFYNIVIGIVSGLLYNNTNTYVQ